MKKNRNIIYIISILLFCSTTQYSQEYKLYWSDEFNDRDLNENIWTRQTGGGGWGNEEIQFYTDRDTNAYLQDGTLIIRALEENYGGRNYTSARLITKDNIFFNYGKIEARIRLPYGQGIWPAFWLLGQNINSVGWPACGEIDIMEMIGGGTGRNNTIHGTAHWEQNGHASYGGSTTLSSGIFADDFHLFTIEWTPQYIRWFLDDKQYHVIDITPSALSEFHEEFFIILNIAVGGLWPGYPDDTTIFPQIMEVDYVRVYQDASKFPEIILTEPSINNFTEYSDIKISTDVAYDGSIAKVEFYQDKVQIGETYVEPYEMIWKGVSTGHYKLSAKAISSDGYISESNYANITVGDGSLPSPYTGRPISIPGEIEAEDYNIGGAGIAFLDNSIQNEGFSYRTQEGVDIEVCIDENGGYNIGWTEPDEWISYLIDVSEEGIYDLNIRAASENGGSLNIEIDDNVVSKEIIVPNTGGWQDWITINSSLSMTPGLQNFKVNIMSGSFNINKFEIYKMDSSPEIELLNPIGGETLVPGSIYTIEWKKVMVDKVSLGLSLDGGNNWSFVAKDINAKYGFYRWIVPESLSDNCILMIVDAENSSINDINDSPFSISNVTSIGEYDLLNIKYNLKQNYPNPFNPVTTIEYSVPISGWVKMKVYDQLGREVKILVNEFSSAGVHKINFDGTDLVSGVYVYKLETEYYESSKKLLLLK